MTDEQLYNVALAAWFVIRNGKMDDVVIANAVRQSVEASSEKYEKKLVRRIKNVVELL